MNDVKARPGWDTGDWTGLPLVTIHEYDPAWPGQYAAARHEIAAALAGLDASIEHVGSTAVPGLAARSGIDVLIGVGDPAATGACVERLQALGYSYHFARPDWAHLSGRGHKLHLTPRGSEFWTRTLLFRDYLRAHPETAADYERLKRALARTHGSNGQRYVEGKTAFVESVLTLARQDQPG